MASLPPQDTRPARPDSDDLVVALVHPSRTPPHVDLDGLARLVLESERCQWTYVGVILADHDRVHELNREYLGHDYRTDVLSFLFERTVDGLEGEVYVDLDMAEINAARFGEEYEREVARYVVHGLLHLAGHDDATDAGRTAMRNLEDRYLAAHFEVR